ncbi:imine reductase family protein [Nocardia farcinica]|uniref:imine reductase family protein n=1 Tax=Nocardia farcinica TaxID=37329 RepID=UPI00378AEE5C
MTGQNTSVTVLGTGSMGTAVAEALLSAGHPTTVWNRTPERAAASVVAGAAGTRDRGGCRGEPVDHRDRDEFCGYAGQSGCGGGCAEWADDHHVEQRNTGIRKGIRRMGHREGCGIPRWRGEECARGGRKAGHAAVFRWGAGDLRPLLRRVAGARWGPRASGGRAGYRRALRIRGRRDFAPRVARVLRGAAMVASRGLSARSMVPYSVKWLQMIESLLPVLAEEIDHRDYTRLGSSIGLFHAAIEDDRRLGEETGVDMSWHVPMHDLLRRAVDEGQAAHSVTALIELLAPDRTAVRDR